MNRNKKKFNKGFGLLEVLVSGTVIIIILSALLVIAKFALNNSVYLQQRATATYLAQEQIELARQIRDTNWIDSNPATEWDYFDLVKSCKDNNKCICKDVGLLKISDAINANQGKIGVYPASAYPSGMLPRPMFVTSTINTLPQLINNVKYKIATYFTDVGSLLPGGSGLANNAIIVNVEITWYPVGFTRTLDVSEVLTNWRPNF